MTYRFEQRSPSGRILYQQKREARGEVNIWDEVILMALIVWGSLFFASLGLGWFVISVAIIPTKNELISMIGASLFISGAFSVPTIALLWDSYQMRVWSNEEIEYEDVDEPPQGDNIWQQTGPNTIARTLYKYPHIVLHDLALNCFNSDGTWKETEFVRRDAFKGIGINDMERKYKRHDIQRDFVAVGWMIKVDDRYRWTARGKRELWKHYPATALPLPGLPDDENA